MKYDKGLINIIREKNFKTFWHLLDFLLLTGYSTIESFGISLQEFGEPRIYSDVAFIRLNLSESIILANGLSMFPDKKSELIVGLIDENNIHLDGIYRVYREWMVNDKFMGPQEDIETTCSVIKINDLTAFMIDYLINVSKLHYGYEVFKIKKPHSPSLTLDAINRFSDEQRYQYKLKEDGRSK